MMYEYAYVSDGKVSGVERLAEPLPADHPKVKAGILVPVAVADLPIGWVRGEAAGFNIADGVATRVFADREMTADEIAERKAALVAAIKDEAGQRITAKMPTYKQLNWLAQGLRNILTIGLDLTKWTPKQRQDLQATLAAFTEIEAVRAKSDAKEAELAALTKAADVAAYKPGENW